MWKCFWMFLTKHIDEKSWALTTFSPYQIYFGLARTEKRELVMRRCGTKKIRRPSTTALNKLPSIIMPSNLCCELFKCVGHKWKVFLKNGVFLICTKPLFWSEKTTTITDHVRCHHYNDKCTQQARIDTVKMNVYVVGERRCLPQGSNLWPYATLVEPFFLASFSSGVSGALVK